MDKTIIIKNESGCFNSLGNGGYIKVYPSFPIARLRKEYTTVYGVNGSLEVTDEAYDDITTTIELVFKYKPDIEFLKGFTTGTLEFEFEDYFRKIKEIQTLNLEKDGQRYVLTIGLRVDPFIYYNSLPITVEKEILINNFATLPSEPIIKVYGTGNGNIYINDEKIELIDIEEYLTVDCQEQECYKDGEYFNNKMIGDFINIPVGFNTIKFDGGITKLEIIPNWRGL